MSPWQFSLKRGKWNYRKADGSLRWAVSDEEMVTLSTMARGRLDLVDADRIQGGISALRGVHDLLCHARSGEALGSLMPEHLASMLYMILDELGRGLNGDDA